MRKPARDATVRKANPGWKDLWAGAANMPRTDPSGRLLRLEGLEQRTLLSASSGVVPVDNLFGMASSHFAQASVPNDNYYSPQWLDAAYNDNNIYFGTAAGNGAGQTIAIVDAYNDPNIAGDLTQFDAQYGLAGSAEFYGRQSERQHDQSADHRPGGG